MTHRELREHGVLLRPHPRVIAIERLRSEIAHARVAIHTDRPRRSAAQVPVEQRVGDEGAARLPIAIGVDSVPVPFDMLALRRGRPPETAMQAAG